MQCPACNVALVMSERQGIEIDYCPKCRGIWLDRGELDKLIAAGGPDEYRSEPQERPRQEPRRSDERHYQDDHYYKKKKKESFLKDLFDF